MKTQPTTTVQARPARRRAVPAVFAVDKQGNSP